MTYKAPVDDIVFTLNHEAGFDRLVQSGAYPDLSDDLVDAILDEAAKFADNVVAPLSWEGDQTGARLEAGARRRIYIFACEAGLLLSVSL